MNFWKTIVLAGLIAISVNPRILAETTISLGPRPFFLVDQLPMGELKERLENCDVAPFTRSDFSIAHRGAPLQFPEHTRESYVAGARMGAGLLECDVTFTKDKALVCRHSQCDLHTTTNVLSIPDLAGKCSVPFTPADPMSGAKARARCCTSDFTLSELRRLRGKIDAANPHATDVDQYLSSTADWRTDLYVTATSGTLLTHDESIALFQQLGVKMTPELKTPQVAMPYQGFSQADYAQKLIDEYKRRGVAPGLVFPQSFNLDDVLYWIENEPAFGRQAVYLDGRYTEASFDHTNPATWRPSMTELAAKGVNYLAPPLWMLLRVDGGDIAPSVYALEAKKAGLKLIAWTIERSGPLEDGGGWYYQTISEAIANDGDVLRVLDVLAREVGVVGVFSDWPATTTYYANCLGR